MPHKSDFWLYNTSPDSMILVVIIYYTRGACRTVNTNWLNPIQGCIIFISIYKLFLLVYMY